MQKWTGSCTADGRCGELATCVCVRCRCVSTTNTPLLSFVAWVPKAWNAQVLVEVGYDTSGKLAEIVLTICFCLNTCINRVASVDVSDVSICICDGGEDAQVNDDVAYDADDVCRLQ